MAGQSIEFPGFPRGLDNLHREDSLPPDALRAAVNIDLDVNGKPSRRRGLTQVLSGDVHSMTSCFDCLVAVVDGTLKAYDRNHVLQATVAVTGDRRLQHALTPHRAFWTDGQQLRSFDSTLLDAPAWPAVPGWAASATVQAAGGLPEGSYQIAITAVDAVGRESGAGRAQLVDGVGHNGGVLLTGLPDPADAVSLRIYATDCNGTTLRLVGETPPGSPSYLVAWGPRGQTLELDHQWLEPMPAGQAVCFHMGRLWVASGRYLCFSQPMRYGAMLPDNKITFGEDITLLAPAGTGPEAGLYVAAGKRTLYLSGANPKEAPLTASRATGAVPNSSRSIHTSAFGAAFESLPQVMASIWVSSDGVFCLGLPGGSVLPLTEKRVVLPTNADSAAVMLRNQDGLSQVVASVSGGDTSRAGASDSLTATLYRNGIAVVE